VTSGNTFYANHIINSSHNDKFRTLDCSVLGTFQSTKWDNDLLKQFPIYVHLVDLVYAIAFGDLLILSRAGAAFLPETIILYLPLARELELFDGLRLSVPA